MVPTYTFANKTTSVSFVWPSAISGVERIALFVQGEFQRVLRPCLLCATDFHHCRLHPHILVPYTGGPKRVPLPPPPPAAISKASEETPIIQTRQAHLVCSGKIVCAATPPACITSPSVAHFFLIENYAIGQMFRRIEKPPRFELQSVGVGPYPCEDPDVAGWSPASNPGSEEELWRKYKLIVPDFECEIVEVFPDRDMFVGGVNWLDG